MTARNFRPWPAVDRDQYDQMLCPIPAVEEHRRRKWVKAHPFEDAIRLANSHRDELEARRQQLRGGAR